MQICRDFLYERHLHESIVPSVGAHSLCLRFHVLDVLVDEFLLMQDVRGDVLGSTDLAEAFLEGRRSA